MFRKTVISIVAVPLIALTACEEKQEAAPASTESDARSAAGSPTRAVQTPEPAAPADAPSLKLPDASEQIAQVSESLKTAMNDYIVNLGEANDVLGDVKSAIDAAAASPKLSPIVDKLKGFKSQWDGLDPAMKDQLSTMFKEKVQPLVDQVNQQIQRISNDPTFGSQLKSLLGDIPLIEI